MKKTACVHVGILTLKSREFSPEPPHLQSIFVQNELFLPEKDSNIHKLPKKDNQMYIFLIFNATFLLGYPVAFQEF